MVPAYPFTAASNSRRVPTSPVNPLSIAGGHVVSAGSGKEALQIAGERSFDLIISDISMPEMDGYQLLKQIRGLANGENLPALALTGHGRSHDVTRAKAEGFADHLTKPIDINRFLRTVRRLTDGV